MEQESLAKPDQLPIKKVDRQIISPTSPSPEELLNSLADIIIERIIEESKNEKIPMKV